MRTPIRDSWRFGWLLLGLVGLGFGFWAAGTGVEAPPTAAEVSMFGFAIFCAVVAGWR